MSVDISGCFKGSFTQQAGKTFNELPLNVKNIEKYDTFLAKCSKYYFDKAISCAVGAKRVFLQLKVVHIIYRM